MKRISLLVADLVDPVITDKINELVDAVNMIVRTNAAYWNPKQTQEPERKEGCTCMPNNYVPKRGCPIHDTYEKEPERKYACADCGVLRTKDEGGTTFTVCDECWDKRHKKEPITKHPQDGGVMFCKGPEFSHKPGHIFEKPAKEKPAKKEEPIKVCAHLEWKFSNAAGKVRLFFTNAGHGQAICDGWQMCPLCGMEILDLKGRE